MKKLFYVPLLLLLFSACHTNTSLLSDQQMLPDSTKSIANSIVEIAATDFFKNQQPLPQQFRDVVLKKLVKPDGEVLYLLCGDFAAIDSQWTHFTTIKNSDYEQWIGPNGISYCNQATPVYFTENLAEALTQRMKKH